MNDATPDAKGIFFEALEKETPAEMEALLDRACAGNARLRGRVEDLLRAHHRAGNFLGGAAPPSETVDIVEPIDEAGRQLGPYKLLQKLGEGGMGTVYMAQQQQPVCRRVAVKIIKQGMDSKQFIA